MNRIWHINELDQLIDYVKANQGNKNIILLHGDLGSGKTTFVRKYCEKINIINQVSSPSFLILNSCLLYTSPSPRDLSTSRMPSSA